MSNNPFKSFDPFQINTLQEMLNKNRDLIQSFFGDQLFDENFIDRIVQKGNVLGDDSLPKESSSRTIPMDLIQRKNELLLIFEIPGLNSEEDVDIKVYGSTLIIEGEIKRNYLISDKEQIKFERKVGTFSKKVVLPVIFDHQRIHAKYINGLLEVRLPVLKSNRYEKVSVNFLKT